MKHLLFLALFIISSPLVAQKTAIDKIVAVVGEEIILKSDLENAFLQEQSQGLASNSANLKTEILEQQLIQKLLMAQAKIDSIEVSEDELESSLDYQIESYISNIGSKEKLEQYFGKSIVDIKNNMREPMREKMITERMQQKIVEKIRITPSEIRNYYKSLSKDSLPDIPDKFEIQQIVIKPTISSIEKERIREKLRTYREEILSGEKTFNTLAVLYSEGPSAPRGGEIGYSSKTTLDPAFAEAAFALKKPGDISKIVESEFGFHIIQLIDRQGEKINVRHILLIPNISETEKVDALNKLDTIRKYINNQEMTFEEAAFYFSTDKQSKNNGGLYVNNTTGEVKIPRANIPGEMAKEINSLKGDEISEPFITHSASGAEEFKIVKIKKFYPQHKANLEDDWMNFELQLKNEKEMQLLERWIKEKQSNTYVRIDEDYKNSKFRYNGWIK